MNILAMLYGFRQIVSKFSFFEIPWCGFVYNYIRNSNTFNQACQGNVTITRCLQNTWVVHKQHFLVKILIPCRAIYLLHGQLTERVPRSNATFNDIADKKIKGALKSVGPNSQSIRVQKICYSSSAHNFNKEVQSIKRQVGRLQRTEKTNDSYFILTQRADKVEDRVRIVNRMPNINAKKPDATDLGGLRKPPTSKLPPMTPLMAHPVKPTEVPGVSRGAVVDGLYNGGSKSAVPDFYDTTTIAMGSTITKC